MQPLFIRDLVNIHVFDFLRSVSYYLLDLWSAVSISFLRCLAETCWTSVELVSSGKFCYLMCYEQANAGSPSRNRGSAISWMSDQLWPCRGPTSCCSKTSSLFTLKVLNIWAFILRCTCPAVDDGSICDLAGSRTSNNGTRWYADGERKGINKKGCNPKQFTCDQPLRFSCQLSIDLMI